MPESDALKVTEQNSKNTAEVSSFEVSSNAQGGQVEFDKKYEDLKRDINEFKGRTIEILAIFVALFTFVSVDIQIFKMQITFLSVTGFSLIMLGSLLFFVFILHKFLNPDKKIEKIEVVSFIMVILLISIGIFLTIVDYKKINYEIQSDFYTKKQIDDNITSSTNEVQRQLDNLKICLKNGGWVKCFN